MAPVRAATYILGGACAADVGRVPKRPVAVAAAAALLARVGGAAHAVAQRLAKMMPRVVIFNFDLVFQGLRPPASGAGRAPAAAPDNANANAGCRC